MTGTWANAILIAYNILIFKLQKVVTRSRKLKHRTNESNDNETKLKQYWVSVLQSSSLYIKNDNLTV